MTANNLKVIKSFLSLPVGAMPSAMWMTESGEDRGNVWNALRGILDGEISLGDQVLLSADRPSWENVIVYV